ncbi:MAG: hypothetical protein WCX32_00450 [Clostridia bacterium]|jgi:hypothetical protein|nr:hypothetical protein [Clostridia bacterium]MDD4276128.1 hypothetical protein [Clostridia bacterium]
MFEKYIGMPIDKAVLNLTSRGYNIVNIFDNSSRVNGNLKLVVKIEIEGNNLSIYTADFLNK